MEIPPVHDLPVPCPSAFHFHSFDRPPGYQPRHLLFLYHAATQPRSHAACDSCGAPSILRVGSHGVPGTALPISPTGGKICQAARLGWIDLLPTILLLTILLLTIPLLTTPFLTILLLGNLRLPTLLLRRLRSRVIIQDGKIHREDVAIYDCYDGLADPSLAKPVVICTYDVSLPSPSFGLLMALPPSPWTPPRRALLMLRLTR